MGSIPHCSKAGSREIFLSYARFQSECGLSALQIAAKFAAGADDLVALLLERRADVAFVAEVRLSCLSVVVFR